MLNLSYKSNSDKKILILGISGLLGHKLFLNFDNISNYVYGTTSCSKKSLNFFLKNHQNIFYDFNINNENNLSDIFKKIEPDLVINCVAITSVNTKGKNITDSLEINSILPHKIKNLSIKYNFRLIHFSTDSVYYNSNILNTESSKLYPNDLYTVTKLLGEVQFKNVITIRTSIIGHSLKNNKKGMLDWFLSSSKEVIGYSNFIWSGFTTLEIFNIIYYYIIKNDFFSGTINLSSNKISKYDLLKLISKYYKKEIKIIKDKNIKVNRNLDSNIFDSNFNYKPPSWNDMISQLSIDYNKNKYLYE